MFIGVYELEDKEYFSIYYKNKLGYEAWHQDTFSPETKNIEILDFKITGKTYRERQASLEDLAKEWQLRFWQYSWSYGELYEINNYFYENGKRYGLLNVFHENGIC